MLTHSLTQHDSVGSGCHGNTGKKQEHQRVVVDLLWSCLIQRYISNIQTFVVIKFQFLGIWEQDVGVKVHLRLSCCVAALSNQLQEDDNILSLCATLILKK